MLTADTITRSEAFATVEPARAPRVLLPVDPGEEEPRAVLDYGC
jgi:hypothetical protein